jgi:hypothetical protein
MNLKENIKRILKEETSLQSKLQNMIDTKGIDMASTAVGGMKNVAKILNLDLDDVDTQSMLVKNFIEHTEFDDIDVVYITDKISASGNKNIILHIKTDDNSTNVVSWYIREICEYLNKELFPFKVQPSWNPVFASKGVKIFLNGEIIDEDMDTDDEEELTEKWSEKYKRSINCNNPKGFSQKAHCAGRRKKSETKEGELNERCWKGYTQKGMKTMFGKRYPNCVKKTK